MNGAGPEQEQGIVAPLPLVTQRAGKRENTIIIVVEDEDFVREVTCEVLLSAGYVVLRARTATEAIRLFRRDGEKLQLLLTDVVLPGRSGQALAEELSLLSPGLRTIFISGYPKNGGSVIADLPAGSFYLPKPFSAEMLLGIVGAALAERTAAASAETLVRRAWSSG